MARSAVEKRAQPPVEHPPVDAGGAAHAGADAERAAAIVASLGKGLSSAEEVFAAYEELDALPPEIVRSALASWTGPAPDPERLDPATRSAHGFPQRRLNLRTLAIVKDADVLDLGPIAEEQLRLAGKSWDGLDLAPEERLDGESEGSFAGTVEHRVLGDADTRGGAALFDVLLFAGDSGVIFRGGTTDLVGAITYGVVELKDRRERAAIQEALARPVESIEATPPEDEENVAAEHAPKQVAAPPTAKQTASPPKAKAVAKKAVAKKVAAKTVAAKKSVAKKATAKKATAKEATAKKTVAKKAVAKKAVAKKTVAKKAVAKKTVAKKTVAKKAVAKKTVAKKARP